MIELTFTDQQKFANALLTIDSLSIEYTVEKRYKKHIDETLVSIVGVARWTIKIHEQSYSQEDSRKRFDKATLANIQALDA